MTVRPYTPPRVLDDATRVPDWNRLAASAGSPLPFGNGATATFRLTGAPAGALPRTTFLVAGLPFDVVITAFPFRELSGVDLSAEEMPDLPDSLRDALTEGMLDYVRRRLPEALSVDDPKAGTADRAGTVWLDVVLAGLAPGPIRLAIAARPDDLASAARLLPVPRLRGLLGTTPVTVEATLLRLGMTARDIGRLAPGRFVLLPAEAGEVATLRAPRSLHRFQRTDQGWRCLSSGPLEALRLPNDPGTDPMAAEDPATPVLPVDFDIGGIEVTLADLDGWRPGTILPFTPPVPGDGLTVTIRVAGAPVGVGELVAVEDRWAVRIQHLTGAAG